MKETIFLKIAKINIQINFNEANKVHSLRSRLKSDIVIQYDKFITENIPKSIQFTIELTNKFSSSILTVQPNTGYLNFYKLINNNKIVSYYHISITQFQFLLGIALTKSLSSNGLIIHASANLYNGRAVLFSGPSGIGKSTIMKLLNEKYPALADDVVIITKENNTFYMYQTSLYGKEWWVKQSQKRYKISAFFFLHQSKYLSSFKLTERNEILSKIMKQLWLNDKLLLNKQLNLLMHFIASFNQFYELKFFPEKYVVIKHVESICKK